VLEVGSLVVELALVVVMVVVKALVVDQLLLLDQEIMLVAHQEVIIIQAQVGAELAARDLHQQVDHLGQVD
jgi:hypothetical protein